MSYDEEAKALFSHRADIKAKRNYIRLQKKERERERTKANANFADTTMTFLMLVSFIVLATICCM